MELEVEKDVEAHAGDLAHVIRAVGGEQLQADLHPAQLAAQVAEIIAPDLAPD